MTPFKQLLLLRRRGGAGSVQHAAVAAAKAAAVAAAGRPPLGIGGGRVRVCQRLDERLCAQHTHGVRRAAASLTEGNELGQTDHAEAVQGHARDQHGHGDVLQVDVQLLAAPREDEQEMQRGGGGRRDEARGTIERESEIDRDNKHTMQVLVCDIFHLPNIVFQPQSIVQPQHSSNIMFKCVHIRIYLKCLHVYVYHYL